MSSFIRKLERVKEKHEQENIKKVYGKKPKGVCPNCKKQSMFFTNENGETYCMRCDALVKTK